MTLRSLRHIVSLMLLFVCANTALAQNFIEVCHNEDRSLTFDKPNIGSGDFVWYTRNEGSDNWKKSGDRYSFKLESDKTTLYDVYGLDLNDACNVIVTDTFTVVPTGQILYREVLERAVTDATDLAITFDASPLLFDTSQVIVNKEFRFLLDPSVPGNPDSIVVELPGFRHVKLSGDTTELILPLSSFREPKETSFGIERPLEYEVYAYWNNCSQKKVKIPVTKQQYSPSNFISTSNGFTFFASGLIEEMVGGKSPGKLMGIYNNKTTKLDQLSLLTGYAPFDHRDSSFVNFASFDSLSIAAKDTLFYDGIDHRGDSIKYPTGLQNGRYNVQLRAYKLYNGEEVALDQQPFRYRNELDYGPILGLEVIRNLSLNNTLHEMELEIITSPYGEYFSPLLDYYFLSEDKMDTTETRTIGLPTLILSDTIQVQADLITEDNQYVYDSVYMSVKTSDGFEIETFALPTNLQSVLIEPRNGTIYQSTKNHPVFRRLFIGDTLVNAIGQTKEEADEFTDFVHFNSVPSDSVIGEFYTVKDEPEVTINYDIGYSLRNFYNEDLEGELNDENINLKTTLYASYQAVSGNIRRNFDSLFLKSWEKDTLLSFEDNSTNSLQYKAKVDGNRLFNFSDSLSNVIGNGIDSARFYLQTVLTYNEKSLIPSDFEQYISDTLLVEIVPLKQPNFEINLEAHGGALGNTCRTCIWTNTQWNALNKRTTPELGETYDLLGVFYQRNPKLPLDDIQVGIYETTDLYDSLMSIESKRIKVNNTYSYSSPKRNSIQAIMSLGASDLTRINQVFNKIHFADSLFNLVKIDTLSNLVQNPSELRVGEFLVPTRFDKDRRSYLVVIDPYDHIKEAREFDNIDETYRYEYLSGGADLDIPPLKERYNPDQSPSPHKFIYKGEEYQIFHADEDNEEKDLLTGNYHNNPNIRDTFNVRSQESIKLKLAIVNNGIARSSQQGKFIIKIQQGKPAITYDNRRNYITIDTLDINEAVKPLGEERLTDSLYYIEYDLVPGQYIREGQYFNLRTELLYPGDPDTVSTSDNWRQNQATYDFTRMRVKNPNFYATFMLPEGNYGNDPTDNIFECGSEYELKVKLSNFRGAKVDHPFEVILTGLPEGEVVLDVDGIDTNEEKILTYKFPLAVETNKVVGYQLNLGLYIDIEKNDDRVAYGKASSTLIIAPDFSLEEEEDPRVFLFDGNTLNMRTRSNDESFLYHWEARYFLDDGTSKVISGVSNSRIVNLADEGFDFSHKYGRYSASFYISSGDCKYSMTASSNFELKPPPPPKDPPSGDDGSGGNDDDSGGGGDDGGGGSTGGGCYWDALSSLVDKKFTVFDDGRTKFWFRFKNNESKKVDYQVCIQRSNGKWDCGQGSLASGSTSIWYTYNPKNNGTNESYNIPVTLYFRDYNDSGCRFPKK
tara:strand:- start:1891 stop:6117 length:4227 start_codon:yes stop_codon:yes gene_type:complete